VLLNILSNAADAFEGITAPVITISTVRSGNRIVIRIMDNGKGIPDDQKRHLFKPFSTTKSHGTGLGLVIVKKMLLKMNATIEIESHEKAGTTVTLNLPANSSHDA